MENKEKQILTITQDLSDCLEYDIEDSSVVDTYDTACNLVNKGWVKLPEDSVVLSKEEQEVRVNALIETLNEVKLQASKEMVQKIYKEYLCDILSLEAKEEFAKQFEVEIEEVKR